MNTDELLTRYQSGYQFLVELISEIPKEALTYKSNDNSLSIAESIVHLCDAEARGFLRAKKIIAESGSKVEVYNQQFWANSLFYSEMNYQDTLEMIRFIRKNLFEVLKRIKPEVWQNYIYHPETGKITLHEWINLNVDHIEVHLRQIRKIHEDWMIQMQEKQSVLHQTFFNKIISFTSNSFFKPLFQYLGYLVF